MGVGQACGMILHEASDYPHARPHQAHTAQMAALSSPPCLGEEVAVALRPSSLARESVE